MLFVIQHKQICLLEGALPHQIDQALESFGLNMVHLEHGSCWIRRVEARLSGKESPLHAKLEMNFVSKIDMGKKWCRLL